jgi:RimJ/RimL family protein N-acetyltransferase
MEILTPRLILREARTEDVPSFHLYQNDPRYLEHYPWPEWDCERSKALIARFISWSKEKPRIRFQLAVTLRGTGRFIGTCGIRCQVAGDDHGDLGCALSPDHWGNGYAIEATSAMLDLAFHTLDLQTVQATCVAQNERAVRLLRRLGFREAERIPAGTVERGYAWPERWGFELRRRSWGNRPAGGSAP